MKLRGTSRGVLLTSVCAAIACHDPQRSRGSKDEDAGSRSPATRRAIGDAGGAAAPVIPSGETAIDDAGTAARVRVVGRVSELAGGAIPNVTVSLHGRTLASTNTSGELATEAPEGATLSFARAGYRTEQRTVPREGAVRRVDVLLTAIGTIGGAVVDPRGRGVPRATVWLAGSGVWPARKALTDGRGRYAFEDVAEGAYELRAARAPRNAQEMALATRMVDGVTLDGPGDATTVDLRADPAGYLAGTVTTSNGAKVEGARIVACLDALSLVCDENRSDAAGAFRVGPLAPANIWLRVTSPTGVAPAPAQVTLGVGDTPFHVVLPKGARIRGRALAPDGTPLWGARVSIRVESGATHARSSQREAATDRDGRFSLEHVPPGSVRVVARHADHAAGITAPLELLDGEEREVVVELAAPSALSGQVIGELQNPIDGARVVLSDAAAVWPRRILRAGEGGRFRVTKLPPGPWRLVVGEPGFLGEERVIVTRAGAETEVVLRLIRGDVVIEGFCLDEDGKPIAGAQVRVTSSEPRQPISRVTTTDDVGHFRVSQLPRGRYAVRVEGAGFVPFELAVADDTSALDVRLLRAAELAITITDEEGIGVSPAQARLTLREALGVSHDDASSQAHSVAANAAGIARFRGLRTGRYRLEVDAPGFARLVDEDVYVRAAGETSETSVTLRRPPQSP